MATIKIRRDETANWMADNPVLEVGELGLDLDLSQFKVGDGSTPWAMLPVASGSDGPQGVVGNKGIQGLSGSVAKGTWAPRNGNLGSALGTPLFASAHDNSAFVPSYFKATDITKAVIHDPSAPLGTEGLQKILYNPLTGKYVGVGLTKLVNITKTGATLTYGPVFDTLTTGTNSEIAFDAILIPGSNIVMVCRGEGVYAKFALYDVSNDTITVPFSLESSAMSGNVTHISLVYSSAMDRVLAAVATDAGTMRLGHPPMYALSDPSGPLYGGNWGPVGTGAVNSTRRIKAVCAEKNGTIAIAYTTASSLRVIKAQMFWYSTPQTPRTIANFTPGSAVHFDMETDGTNFGMVYYVPTQLIMSVGISCGAAGLKVGSGQYTGYAHADFLSTTPNTIRAARLPDNSIAFIQTYKVYDNTYGYQYSLLNIAGTYASIVIASESRITPNFATPVLGGACVAAGGSSGYELLIGDTLSNRLVTVNTEEYSLLSNNFLLDRYPLGMAISDTEYGLAGTVVSGLTGLETGKVYYLDTYARLSTEPSPSTRAGTSTQGRLGRAISSTELLLTRT